MAEWQTRLVQVQVLSPEWGFNSPRRHQIFCKNCGYGITAVHQPSKLVIGVRPPLPAPLDFGGIPERPKGADCKSASDAFDGSNPSPATIFVNQHQFKLVFFCVCKILFSEQPQFPVRVVRGGSICLFFPEKRSVNTVGDFPVSEFLQFFRSQALSH